MADLFEMIRQLEGPYVIAEIGVNYYDIAQKMSLPLMDAAKLMIDKAKEGGADAVKFQSYKAGKLASKFSPAYWDLNAEPTDSQYKLFQKFDRFGADEYQQLARHTKDLNMVFMSTPFDFEAADYLEDLMPAYKISSSDITNLPFIEHIARKNKPIFLSTGASYLGEIETAVQSILKTGNNQICILHCILQYPTGYENANLNMIKYLRQVFPDYLVGFSDHTLPDPAMLLLITACQFGAKVIEKHFTLDKTLKGNDHYHAMDPEDLKKFRENLTFLKTISGEFHRHPLACEENSRKYARRSLVAKRNLNKGEALTLDNVTFKRPGTGISPVHLDIALGRELKQAVKEDEIITWDHV